MSVFFLYPAFLAGPWGSLPRPVYHARRRRGCAARRHRPRLQPELAGEDVRLTPPPHLRGGRQTAGHRRTRLPALISARRGRHGPGVRPRVPVSRAVPVRRDRLRFRQVPDVARVGRQQRLSGEHDPGHTHRAVPVDPQPVRGFSHELHDIVRSHVEGDQAPPACTAFRQPKIVETHRLRHGAKLG